MDSRNDERIERYQMIAWNRMDTHDNKLLPMECYSKLFTNKGYRILVIVNVRVSEAESMPFTLLTTRGFSAVAIRKLQ